MAIDTTALVESLGASIAASVKPAKQLSVELPALTKAVDEAATLLLDCIEDLCALLLQRVQELSDGIKEAIRLLKDDEGGGRDFLSDFGTIASILGTIIAAAVALVGAGVITATVGWIIAIVAAIVGAIGLIALHWETVVGALTWLGGVVWAGIVWLNNTFWALVGWVINTLWGIGSWLVSTFWGALGWLNSTFWSAVGWAISTLWGVGSWLVSTFWGALGWLNDTFWSAVGWVVDKLSDIWDAVTGIPGAIADAIGDIGGSLLPFQTGGVVPGSRGAAVPILAHAGEGVFNQEQMAAIGAGAFGGGAVAVTINGAGLDRRLLEWLRHAVRVEGGGSVQTALGQ